MKHYIDKDNNIYAYEEDGSQDYLIGDKTFITLEEVIALQKENENKIMATVEYKVNEAKAYLSSTDYKMTVDYFSTLDKEIQDELIRLRAEAREFIRNNE